MLLCLLTVLVSVNVRAGSAAAHKKWGPHIEVYFKAGNKRSLGELDVFAPIWQNNRAMVFANLRGNGDLSANIEGNFGVGYRRIMNGEWIFGTYAYFDIRRTKHGNTFVQGTIGIEMLTSDWDFRANGYIPEPGSKRVNSLSIAEVNGNQIVVREGIERALAGGDGEIGRRLPVDGAEVRAYVGGYYFGAPGVQSVAGPRGRIEARFLDLNLWGASDVRLTIAMEAQWDKPRGAQVFGTIGLRISLGSPSASTSRSSLSVLDRRMTERVIRDVDIVSQETLGAPEPAVHGGQLVSDINFVGTGGDLKNTIEVKSGNNGVVVVNGTINVPGTVAMKQGQVIIGGGTTLALTGAHSGAVATFSAPGAAGIVNGTGGGVVLSAATNTMIAGLSFTGGDQQISAANITNVVIRDTDHTLAGAAPTAIIMTNVTGLVVDRVTITGPGAAGTGVSLTDTQASITATDIAGTQFGVAIGGSSSVAFVSVSIKNTQFGVFIWALGAGVAIETAINSSVFTGNGFGLVALGTNGGTVSLSGAGNTLSGNTTDCFVLGPVFGSVGATPQKCPP